MEKSSRSQKLYYSIGEVAEVLGESPSLIRYWEQQFEELKPRRSGGGTRHYTREDIEVLQAIHSMLKKDGLTIKGAKEKLREHKSGASGVSDTIRLLTEMKQFLITLGQGLEEEESPVQN
jgi:DNA-binding transcriptional MerR regulator